MARIDDKLDWPGSSGLHQHHGLPPPLEFTTVDAPFWRRIFQDDGLRTECCYDVAHINMPPVGAQCQTLDPFRTVNRSIGPFIGHFRMQVGISYDAFLNLRLGLDGKTDRLRLGSLARTQA